MPEKRAELAESHSLGDGSGKVSTNNNRKGQATWGKERARPRLAGGSGDASGRNSSETEQPRFYLECHSFLAATLFCFRIQNRNEVHFRRAFECKFLSPSVACSTSHREFQPGENTRPARGCTAGLYLLVQVLKPFLPVNSPSDISSFIYQFYSKKFQHHFISQEESSNGLFCFLEFLMKKEKSAG